MNRSWQSLLGVLALAALAGCDDLPGKPRPKDRPERPDRVLKFQPLFAANCAGCHGAEGKLGPAPPLNDPLFLKIVPETELALVISSGRHKTLMPAFDRSHPGGSLTDDQIVALIDGLKSTWGHEPAVRAPIPDYLESAAIARGARPGQVSAGQAAYKTACATCHGNDGQGTEGAGRINSPAFLALMSDQALRRLIITGRPDLGMPSFAEPAGRPPGFKPLTNQDVNDIMALLQSWKKKQE